MLGIDKAIDFSKGDPFQRCIAAGKEHLEIQGITLERGGGVMAPLQIGPKLLDRTGNGWHRSPRKDRLAFFNPLHGLIILLAAGVWWSHRVACSGASY